MLGNDFGLSGAVADALQRLDRFYAAKIEPGTWNRHLIASGREIVRLGYAARSIFEQDPARPMGMLPVAEGLLVPLDPGDHATATRFGACCAKSSIALAGVDPVLIRC